MHPEIAYILAENGAIATKQHPNLGSTLRRLHLHGDLDNPLPGVFVAPGQYHGVTRLRAVSLWSAPLGVLHERTAAGIWFPGIETPLVRLAHPTLRSRSRVHITRRQIPREFIRSAKGLRTASAAYVAAELAAFDDGRAATEVLRLKLATPDELRQATRTLAATVGHEQRTRVIAACADNPWSYAELRLHRILRETGITGWVANRPIRIGSQVFDPDIRFLKRRVIIEVDGRETHLLTRQFLLDRQRQNAFTVADFRVIRFTWEQLDDPAYVITVVRAVLALACR